MKKIKYIILIFIAISVNNKVFSQFFDDFKNKLKTKPKIFIKYNTRNSLISTKGARIQSVNTGLDFNKTIRIGIGYEWLGSEIKTTQIIDKNNTVTDTVDARLKLAYISVFGEYVFYKKNKWEISMPLMFSFGKASYAYNYNNTDYNANQTFIYGYENHMIAQYSIFKWLGIGLGTGYRIIIKDRKKIKENFTSPIYIIKLKILFENIIRKKNKKNDSTQAACQKTNFENNLFFKKI